MNQIIKLSKQCAFQSVNRSASNFHQTSAMEDKIASSQLLRAGDYSYRLLNQLHWKQASDLLVQAFNQQNPLNVSFLKLKPYLKELTFKNQRLWWIQQQSQYINNMSLVICNSQNKVFGVNVVKDFFDSKHEDPYSQLDDQCSRAQSALYDQLIKGLPTDIASLLQKKGKVLQMSGAALSPILLKQGHYRNFLQMSAQCGRKHGFEYAFGFVTKPDLIRSLKSIGYNIVSSLDAHKFVFNGQIPFRLVEEKNRYPCIIFKKIV